MNDKLRQEFEAVLRATTDPAIFALIIEKDENGEYSSFYARGLFQGYRLALQKMPADIKVTAEPAIRTRSTLDEQANWSSGFQMCPA